MRERRQTDRQPFSARVRVAWDCAGGDPMVLPGFCLDISEHGMRLDVPQPIPLRSYVTVRVENLLVSIPGRGSVRHCTRKRGRYEIGVEFNGTVKWKAPEPVHAAAFTLPWTGAAGMLRQSNGENTAN